MTKYTQTTTAASGSAETAAEWNTEFSNIQNVLNEYTSTMGWLYDSRLRAKFWDWGGPVDEASTSGGNVGNFLSFSTSSGGTYVKTLSEGKIKQADATTGNLELIADASTDGVDWDKNFVFAVRMKQTTASTNTTLRIGINNFSTLTSRHVGFRIDNATLRATNANNTTETSTDISSGLTLTNYNTYKIIYTAGASAKFYVNETLKATHTTNLPSGAQTSDKMLSIYLNTADVATPSYSVTFSNGYLLWELY